MSVYELNAITGGTSTTPQGFRIWKAPRPDEEKKDVTAHNNNHYTLTATISLKWIVFAMFLVGVAFVIVYRTGIYKELENYR
jgi:hypothetical protein